MRTPFLLLVLVLAACSGDRSIATPTEPSAPALNARLDMGIASVGNADTLRRVKLVFDGRDVATVERREGARLISLEGNVSWTPGTHTIRIVVLDQTSSPNQYAISGSVTLPNKIADLIIVRGVVATGDGLEIKVTI